MYDKNNWDQSILLESQNADPDALVVGAGYPAGYLPLNGTLVNTSIAQLPAADNVIITSSGNDTDVNFTIVGTDENKDPISEVLVGANAGTATSVNTYLTVISITPSAATDGNIQVGDSNAADNICAAQAGTANTALTLNGDYASGNYSNNIHNFITIVAAADESANVFTFTGTDEAGREWDYTTAGPDTATLVIEIPYRIILSGDIFMANATSGDVSIGISTQNATTWIPIDRRRQQLLLGIDAWLSSGATLNYTVEYTKQSVRGPTPPTRIFPDQTLVSQTVSGTTSEGFPWNAVRLRLNSWTDGNVVFETQQADDMHAGQKDY